MSSPTRETTLPALVGFSDNNFYSGPVGSFPGADPGQSFSAFALFNVDAPAPAGAVAPNFVFGNINLGVPSGWAITTQPGAPTSAVGVQFFVANGENVGVANGFVTSAGGGGAFYLSPPGGWILAIASYDGSVGNGELRLVVNGVAGLRSAAGVAAANPAGVAAVGSNAPNGGGANAHNGSVVAVGYVQAAMSLATMQTFWQASFRSGVPLAAAALAAGFTAAYRVPFSNQGTPNGGNPADLVAAASWAPYVGTAPVLTQSSNGLRVSGRTLPF